MAAREWSKLDAKHRVIVERHMAEIPVKLGAMAHELGLLVKLSTMKPGESGMIAKVDDNYMIRINRHETRERQRYTLAHEIAHFLLHRDVIDQSVAGIVDNVLYRSGAPEKMEYEANRLAADLVMPKTLVATKVKSLGALVSEEVIDHMANTFQVSKVAMEIRLSTIAE